MKLRPFQQAGFQMVCWGLLLLMAGCAHNDELYPAPSSLITSRRQANWRTIQHAFDGPIPSTPKDRDQWWRESMRGTVAPFWDLILTGDMEANVSFYVDQFGGHGPKADFAWLCGGAWVTLPEINLQLWHPPTPSARPLHRQMDKTVDEVKRLFAKHLVLRLHSDPVLLDRYYRMILWSRGYFGAGHLAALEVGAEALANPKAWDQKHHWGASLSFLMLAHATGRDDLFQTADPHELQAAAKKWVAWLNKGHNYPFVNLVPVPGKPIWNRTAGLYFGDKKTKLLHIPTMPLPVSDGAFQGLTVEMFDDFIHLYQGWPIIRTIQMINNRK